LLLAVVEVEKTPVVAVVLVVIVVHLYRQAAAVQQKQI
jgi:hypothetical protein